MFNNCTCSDQTKGDIMYKLDQGLALHLEYVHT